MEKKITIKLIESTELVLPGHLKKPPMMDFKKEGINDLECIQLLVSCLAAMIAQYKNSVDEFAKEMNKGNQPN